jgi:tellurite resistance protein
VPNAINIAGTAVWVALLGLYFTQAPRQIKDDLEDPVVAPFISLVPISAMLFSVGLIDYTFDAARVLVVFFLGVTIAAGGWMTGQWIVGDLDQDAMHPGYFLPTVAGGLVGAYAAAAVHLRAVSEASFGIGIICWFLLGSIALNRLFFRKNLPPALIPTMAIELAPPAVAGIAYIALTGNVNGPIPAVLAGYTVLMALVQLRLIPLYFKLSFGPSFWAFTFAYAAAATNALEWIDLKRPPGATAYSIITVILISAFIVAIAGRTIVAVRKGQFLPRPAAT